MKPADPTKRLFNVAISYEIIVLASDPANATAIAMCVSPYDTGEPNVEARPMTHMPNGWDGECLPFCTDTFDTSDEETIDVLVAKCAAPGYKDR